MEKPNKIGYDEFLKSLSMFCIDEDLENKYKEEISKEVMSLSTKLRSIDTEEGLREYIRSDKESLSRILSLLGVSEEKFKRIVSLIRRERRYTFSSEWSLSQTRQMMIEQPSFMDDICELLMNGSSSLRYKGKIPEYYLSSFCINQATMSRLINIDDLTRMVKQQLEVRYNTNASNSMCHSIEKTIEKACNISGYSFDKNKYVDSLGYEFRYSIPSASNPRIVIEYSYNVTTSSTQSKLSNKMEITKQRILDNDLNIVTVVLLEGAGWYGRQSDLKKLNIYADYLLNLTHIDLLESIIFYAMEGQT